MFGCCLHHAYLSVSHILDGLQDAIVDGLLAQKAAANVTFDQIADAIGLLNVQTADIFFRQVQ